MLRISLLAIVALLGTAIPTVRAVYYYENTQFRYSAQQSSYRSSYPSSNRLCLYRNASGVCMVERFIDTSNYNSGRNYYAPTYDRNYLYNERRYSNRYDDDDYYYYSNDDDDNYSNDDDDYYYSDDDDYYFDDDDDIDDDEWEDIKDDFFDDDDDSDDDD